MRILFLSDFYPPVLGGLELQVQAVARGMVLRGHQTSVATLTLDAPGVTQDEGVTVHRIRGWNRVLAGLYEQRERPFHPTVPDPGVVAGLLHIVRSERPQIVYAHSWIVYSCLPIQRRSGARLALMLHDYGLVCPKKTLVYRGGVCDGPGYRKCVQCAAEQYGVVRSVGLTTGLSLMSPLLAKRLDLVLADSNAVADASYHAANRPRAEIVVVPESVPDSAFTSPTGPRPAFVPPSGDFLLFVGALGRHKGLDVLLEAYARLSRTVPLVLVGVPRKDTPTRLPRGVTVAYNVANEDVLAAWPHCTIALVPSIWPEPFGIVAAEAMAAGRPVIASAVGGLRDIVVDGETGLLVPPGNPTALRDAVASLLNNPPERERMGRLGKERARRFAASRVLASTELLFEDLLGSQGGSTMNRD